MNSYLNDIGTESRDHFDQTKESTFCREKYIQVLYTEVTIKLEVAYELDKDH